MSYQNLLVDIDDDGIALCTINRPDELNALNADVMEELDAFFTDAAGNDAIRGIILTGAGDKSFVAGADIKQFRELDESAGRRFAERGQAVFNRVEQMEKPVIAAVNGFALGGGSEMSLACHLRVASRKARFGQPEVKLGIIAGYGGTQRLPRIVGRGIANEILMTGEMIDAERAYEIGLVNCVFEPDELIAGAKELMQKITSQAPRAVGMTLRAIRKADGPLEAGLKLEAELFGKACATDDFTEGVSAFLEKRKPDFSGS